MFQTTSQKWIVYFMENPIYKWMMTGPRHDETESTRHHKTSQEDLWIPQPLDLAVDLRFVALSTFGNLESSETLIQLR